MKKVFSGSGVAIVTPFKDGKVDFKAFGKLIDLQLSAHTDAIIVLGTTGEPATLSDEERAEVLRFSAKKIKGKACFIVGAGSNSTKKAVELGLIAKSEGADAILVVTPFYNKCTQEGLVAHYTEISNKVKLPIIAYNVPGRTGVNITAQTAGKLSKIKYVYGIKEASGNISQIVDMCKTLKNKMAVYSGDDALNYLFMSLGASGVISVTANVVPTMVKYLTSEMLRGNNLTALEMHEKLLELNKKMFIEVNPIPVKFALSEMKLCSGEVRLPLTEMEDSHKKIVTDELKSLQLI